MMTEPKIIRKEITKSLEVVIEDHEREENTERLLQALGREEELKTDLAGYRADINANLKGVRKTIKDMRTSLDKGKDIREVDCEEVWNYEATPLDILGVTVPANSVALVRLDTKELVDEPREITDKERQTSFLAQEQKPGAAGQGLEYPECNRLDLRAAHCGQCDDEDCGGCCWGCTHHLEQGEHPTTCRHPAEGAQAPQEAA